MKTKEFDDLYRLIKNPLIPANLEQHIYKVARRLSASDDQPYDGGYWVSEKIGDGWFFSLNEERRWRVENPNNFSDVHIGSKAFSLAVFLIALSEFSIYLYQKGLMGALSDELAELHGNALSLASEVLTEDDYRAFCAVVD
ncbi:hypothetical protein E0765_07135 [Sulfuricurvum sp. IAE1]|uniref:hypothetical protein n=1 Tax=Sulfuricurvum sp. IAE1 TaxID=2546102 RepID=UPI001045DF64|nr:hypothetical protein [Sulfuricurvum sp. IAE1]TDA63601.1 hypothetical protein E0765_07135 [Sulfuricurvum sp. IAE1]